MNNLVFNVLSAIVVAIAGIVAKSLLPYIKMKKNEALAKLRATNFGFAADIIESVVRAVEQTVSDEYHGDDKKHIAIERIKTLLEQNGIAITDEQMESLIESAVQAMNEGKISEVIEIPGSDSST